MAGPMIGWRSRRIIRRIRRGFAADIANLKYQVLANVAPPRGSKPLSGTVRRSPAPYRSATSSRCGSPGARVDRQFPAGERGPRPPPEDELTDDVWDRLLTRQALAAD